MSKYAIEKTRKEWIKYRLALASPLIILALTSLMVWYQARPKEFALECLSEGIEAPDGTIRGQAEKDVLSLTCAYSGGEIDTAYQNNLGTRMQKGLGVYLQDLQNNPQRVELSGYSKPATQALKESGLTIPKESFNAKELDKQFENGEIEVIEILSALTLTEEFQSQRIKGDDTACAQAEAPQYFHSSHTRQEIYLGSCVFSKTYPDSFDNLENYYLDNGFNEFYFKLLRDSGWLPVTTEKTTEANIRATIDNVFGEGVFNYEEFDVDNWVKLINEGEADYAGLIWTAAGDHEIFGFPPPPESE